MAFLNQGGLNRSMALETNWSYTRTFDFAPPVTKAARRWTGVDSAFSFLFEGVIDIATEKENTLSTVSKRELGSLHFCLPCCQLILWLHAPAKYPFGAASRFRCNGIDSQEEFTGESVNLVGTVNFDMSM